MRKYLILLMVILSFFTIALAAHAQPAPPTGFKWQQTFNDDMDFVDHAKWNGMYATTGYCGGSGLGCSSNYQWLSSAGGALVLTGQINYADFTDNRSGRAAENTNNIFVQRFGYFEWKAQLPHDSGGEGDGLWTALYAFPKGKQAIFSGCSDGVADSGAEEFDVAEVIGSRGNTRQVRFTAHDHCYNEFGQMMPATPGPDLSAAYHTYGLYWKNDGSPHGTVCGFFDGVQQGSCYTLHPSSKLWDNGIFLLNQLIPCPPNNVPFGNGAPCQSGTSSNNPLFVDYTRAWKLVPTGATPGPSSTPSATPTAVPSSTPTPGPTTGCTNAITFPSDHATVGGVVDIKVIDTCGSPGSFNRLYIANKTYDFHATLPFNTNTIPDGAYGIGVITWDNTGRVKLAQSSITIQIANNGPLPTPGPTPRPTPVPPSMNSNDSQQGR